MSIVLDAVDPVTGSFKVSYDSTAATVSDIKKHSINYTVVSILYGSDVSQLSGSFIFDLVCPATATVTSEVQNAGSTTFNPLTDNEARILLPTLKSSPYGCFTPSWRVIRTADGLDLIGSMPSVFSLTATELVISNQISDTDMDNLSSSSSFYFIGTLDDASSTQSS